MPYLGNSGNAYFLFLLMLISVNLIKRHQNLFIDYVCPFKVTWSLKED